VTCPGITNKGQPSISKGKAPAGHGNWYCGAHLDQAPHVESSDEDEILHDFNEDYDSDSFSQSTTDKDDWNNRQYRGTNSMILTTNLSMKPKKQPRGCALA
jgi:hypothetical protein